MNEILQTILSACGGISIIGGALAILWKWVSPAIKLNKRVEALEEHDKRDYEMLQKFAERDSLILETLITLLDSHITGNNEAELKKTRDKLTSYLVQNQS